MSTNPIRIGLVGLGRAGHGMHMEELRPRSDKFQFYAVCDIIPERCEPFVKEFGSKAYTSIEELIADPEVEIVSIATRSCDHVKHAKMALLAGKDVMLEKPFAPTVEEARELIALGSEPAGPRLFMRHNRRLEYGFCQVNDIIDSGILGDVYEIKLTRNSYGRRADWQTIKEFNGGLIMNWGPHIIDHAIRFCGGDWKKLYTDLKHVVAAGDAEDHIKLVFTGVNDRIVDMEISNGVALPTPQYMIYGTRGTLISENDGFRMRYIDPSIRLKELEADPATPGTNPDFGAHEELKWIEETVPFDGPGDGTPRIWDSLYESYRNGKPYIVPLHQALKVVEVIEKAKEGTIFA